MEKDVKIEMVKAASLALDFLKKNPQADTEKIMQHVIKNYKPETEEKEKFKLAGMAAANHAIKFRERVPQATQKQIMQNLTDNLNSILEKIQNQDSAKINSIDAVFEK